MKRLLIASILFASSALFLGIAPSAHAAHTVDLKVNGSDGPLTVGAHNSMIVSWSVEGGYGDLESCVASNNAPNDVAQFWKGYKTPPSGSMEFGSSSPATYTLTLTCYYYTSPTSVVDSVTVTSSGGGGGPAPATTDIKANGSDGPLTVTSGTSVNLTWTSEATQCNRYSIPASSWDRNDVGSSGGPVSVGPITVSTTYTVYCYGGTGIPVDSVRVNVASSTPSVNLKVNNSDGPISIASGASATLTWTSSSVTSCTASNAWSGSKALNNANGESTGNLTTSKTYTLTCGSVSDSVTVDVGSTTGDGTVDLKVAVGSNTPTNGPITIASGTAATLSWTAPGARTCWATGGWNGIGAPDYGLLKAAPNGSESTGVLTASRTYWLQCYTGPGVAATNLDSVTVNVEGSGGGNQAPIADARISADNSSFGLQVTVRRGVPAFIKLSASGSSDPDIWTTPLLGVSQGGKCEWNSDLNTGTITYETTVSSPAGPSSCNIDLGYLTFNDPPGWYLYPVLRITDASSGVSNVASVTVIVNDSDNPTPTPDPSGSPSPTPSCNPFGYNSNCPTPTPTLTPTPTILPTGLPTVTPEPCPPGTTCTVVDDIVDIVDDIVHGIQNGINALVNAVAKGIATLFGLDPEKVAKFLKNAGNALTNLALALGIPLIIANLLPQLANWGRVLGSFFGAHHRKDRWGIVVDSDLGKPVVGAVVQVFDSKFNKLKETQITGKDGQFGFLLIPGQYYIVASASGFTFPASKKPPVSLREHERIYLGEEFTISDANPESIPHLVVPLDREEKVSNTRAIFARFFTALLGFADRVGFTLLFVGAGINTYLLLLSPNALNIFFEVLYLLLFALKLYILVFQQKGVGMVTDGATGGKLDLAIVRLYESATNRIVQTRVTNKNGRFFLLVPKGTYTVAVSKPGYETLTMGDVQIKKSGSEAISLDFELKKQG